MKKIGGTAISAILGMNPWKSPYGVYLDLIGEGEEKPDNEAMARGRNWESALVMLYEAQNGIDAKSRIAYEKLNHDVHEFIVGTPDSVYPTHGLEVKTADIFTRDKYDLKNGIMPTHYYFQCMWYAGLANFDRWDFIVGFFRGDEFVSFETCSIPFDKELYDGMVDAAVEFWEQHVVPRVPPEITEPTEIIEVVRKKFPRHENGKWADATGEIEDATQRLFENTLAAKKIDRLIEADKALIVDRIGDAEGVQTALGKITFKANKDSEKIDWKNVAFHMRNALIRETDSETAASDFDIAMNAFTKTQPGSRVFRLPRWKDEE